LYLKKEKYSEAAHLLLLLKKWEEAGALFEREKMYYEAGRAFEKAGLIGRATINYEKWYETNRELISRNQEAKKKFENIIGALENAGKIDKCMGMLTEQNMFEKAGEICKKHGKLEEAADYFKKSANFFQAAEVYKKLGDEKREFQMLGEAYFAKNQIGKAAQYFEKSGDYERAAKLYEWDNQDDKAAECYYKSKNFVLAGDSYLRRGEMEKAAECYELGKDFQQAASIYHQIGNLTKALTLYKLSEDYFNAGKVAYEMGEAETALEFLRKVPYESPNFFQANFIAGKIYLEREEYDKAEERFLKAINDETINDGNKEYYYYLARTYEEKQKYDEAKTLYNRIYEFDKEFKDIENKVEEIEKKALEKAKFEKAVEDSSERYRIIEKIGEGGMGAVYKAEDLILKRIVALKMLNKEFLQKRKAVERFLSEARTSASLSHPNIITVYDVGQISESYFISMEYIEGETFMDYLRKVGRLTVPQLIFVAYHLFKALDYAHKKGVIHRDIKPHNIMLTKDKQIKVMDFGIAIILTGENREMTFSGTPYYMAPEQILGTSIDHRTDLYSAGATLYHLAAGRPPFAEGDVFSQHLSKKPTSLREIRKDIPHQLDYIILKCLEKDKVNRFQSAGEVLNELRKIRI
jgi:tetratricopeptide (TPR) repeat protein